MSKVSDALSDLMVRAQSIAVIGKKAFIAYDPDDLLRQITAVPGPALGIVYMGMASVPEQGTNRQGRAVTATFGLYLLIDAPPVVPAINQKGVALELLNDIRKTLLGQAPASAHKWRFVSEGLEDASKDRTIWAQRWDTPMILES